MAIYDDPNTCNYCGGKNDKDVVDTINSDVTEYKTKCRSCGRNDYWSYGSFESSQHGYNESDKYYDEDHKLHWYCFSYSGTSLINGVSCTASVYSGHHEINVTLKRINNSKKAANVDDKAVLIGCMYLGHMSCIEFKKGTNQACS